MTEKDLLINRMTMTIVAGYKSSLWKQNVQSYCMQKGRFIENMATYLRKHIT